MPDQDPVTRAFLDECIDRASARRTDRREGRDGQVLATDTQGEVLDECVQLHGGYGFMQEYAVAEMWADARVQRIYGGTNEIMKELIGRAL
jgi:acyl-CoA dehydrogenase